MIIVTNRFDVVPGKTTTGLEWAKRLIANSRKAGFTPPKGGWLLRRRTGDLNGFTLAGQYDSMAEYEEIVAKRVANSENQALFKEMQESDWYAGTESQIAEVVEEI
jgi:hypothetical protein